MKTKFLAISLLTFLFLVAGTVWPSTNDLPNVTVHEWGTFTSVAGGDGQATPWRTYGGREDLPCFVSTFGGFKFQINALVRMETPVLYFYSSQNATADVRVDFPGGVVTEWYPQTAPPTNSSIEWRDVRILPHARQNFPTGEESSHYYMARETDAAPLQVATGNEKFLFYRGIGNFPLPIAAKTSADGKVLVRSVGDAPVEGVLLFENHVGKIGYRIAGTVHEEVALDRPQLDGHRSALFEDLERVLAAHGLYPKEAHAMVNTWRDSWFEEGSRLFYILPKRTVDSVLPLSIQPKPAETSRVFVGRMEIITPEIQDDVKQALARNDKTTLEKYGRFLEPIARRIGAQNKLLDEMYNSYRDRAATCSR